MRLNEEEINSAIKKFILSGNSTTNIRGDQLNPIYMSSALNIQ